LLAKQHKRERSEFSQRYNNAKKQAEHHVRIRYKTEIDAQRVSAGVASTCSRRTTRKPKISPTMTSSNARSSANTCA
jgi:hypothetical protein